MAAALIAATCRVAHFWVDAKLIALWRQLAFATLVICFRAAKVLALQEDETLNIIAWRQRFFIAELIYSSVWSGVALFLFDVRDPAARSCIFAMLLLSSAQNILVAATIPLMVYATLAGAMTALVGFSAFVGPGQIAAPPT